MYRQTMHQRRENLDIIFRRTAPEAVLSGIRKKMTLLDKKNPLHVDACNYPVHAYTHYSLLNMPEYSATEAELRAEAMQADFCTAAMQTDNCTEPCIFVPLVAYAENVLRYDGSSLTCRLDQILNWRSIYLRLGQDIFTTAYLAWKNRAYSSDNMRGHFFTWPAVLKTDDSLLNSMIEKGLAENHFHLHGSTQSFALSWACIMNHPSDIRRYLHDPLFRENLDFHASSGNVDNVMDWERRILYAAMIRALLFERCLGLLDSKNLLKEFDSFDVFPSALAIKNHTEMLRRLYGTGFQQISLRNVCLDYANCQNFYQVDSGQNNRLLAGERSFLYQCFRCIFRKDFSIQESSLFYLYLLIKSNFRSELVQVNNRHGFQNFLNYQNRKSRLFGRYSEYLTEALRLSVCASIEENHLLSLEARIMPECSASEMKRYIGTLDRHIQFSSNTGDYAVHKNAEKLPYFYVVHFAKKPFKDKEYKHDGTFFPLPRNHAVRQLARQQAKALDRYLHCYDTREPRVFGIDACAMEIGCRPETFATEFRYLKARSTETTVKKWYRKEIYPHQKLGLTYHAGEDFLDIADGLRAIDEAVRYLCLEKGDRIGHALALGICPQEYYKTKRYNIYLRKQDYLDNLVWLLYRSLECGVSIGENYRTVMADRAMELLNEIFPSQAQEGQPGIPLDLYYRSWKLRGDHPDLYRSGSYQWENDLTDVEYDRFKIPGGLPQKQARTDGLDVYRNNRSIAGIYHSYHFDGRSKDKGYRAAGIQIDPWYIDLMEEMQCAMRLELFKKGICIECNPTSNVLIGTFQSYKHHPLLRFNDHHLEQESQKPKLTVSINTDDLGVFDTSLGNEYALMFHAICRERQEAGNYDNAAVYEYLDYLRQSGIHIAFWKNFKNMHPCAYINN